MRRTIVSVHSTKKAVQIKAQKLAFTRLAPWSSIHEVAVHSVQQHPPDASKLLLAQCSLNICKYNSPRCQYVKHDGKLLAVGGGPLEYCGSRCAHFEPVPAARVPNESNRVTHVDDECREYGSGRLARVCNRAGGVGPGVGRSGT